MKLKVSKVYESAALQKLNSADIPIAISLRLLDLTEQVVKVIDQLEARRKTVFEKYAKGMTKIPAKDEAKAEAEMQAYLDEEVDIAFEPFTLKELEGVKISSAELASIRWILADKE